MSRCLGFALWLGLLCWTPARASPYISRDRLADGVELLVQYAPGAPTGSLRIVFRTGAERDPPGKAGLAHVVEHLIFQRELESEDDSLWDEVRAAGGSLNAHTTAVATTFQLDAPSRSFGPLARRFLALVTDPPLDRINLSRELGVIKSENLYSAVGGDPVSSLLVDRLFPAELPLQSVIGTSSSRGAITREDIAAFYRTNYSTRVATVIFTGGTSLEDARSILRESFRLPPALASEDPLVRLPVAVLPVQDEVRAPWTAVVFGYGLDEGLWPGCREVAALLELRLTLALRVQQALAPAVRVECSNMRDTKLLLAFAFASSTAAISLPDLLREAVLSARSRAPSAKEWSLVEQHLHHQQALALADSVGLANLLAALASEPRAIGSDLDLRNVLEGEGLPRAAAQKWMKKAFVPTRAVRLSFSPFSGD